MQAPLWRGIGPAMPTLALIALSACATAPFSDRARHYHDLGIRYLEAAAQTPAGVQKDRLCEQAEESCRLSLEYGRGFGHPYNCLGSIELKCARRPERARSFFKEAVSRNPDFAEAHNNIGTTFMRQIPPDYREACDAYEAALEINPEYTDSRENLAVCLVRWGNTKSTQARQELHQRARKQLLRLLEIKPRSAQAHLHLGYIEMERQRFAQAEHHLKQCRALGALPECAYNLGAVYLKTARCEDAILAFTYALRVEGSPVEISARRNLRIAQSQCAKQRKAALVLLDTVKKNPSDPGLRFDLGNIYAAQGLWTEAAKTYAQVVKLDPLYCRAWAKLADYAHHSYDTRGTLEYCGALIACAAHPEGKGRGLDEKVQRCHTLRKQLQEPGIPPQPLLNQAFGQLQSTQPL